jgi:hypothetical protein
MAEPNPYLGKSDAEIKRQFELITQAMEAKDAVKNVVAAAAIRWGYNQLKGDDKNPGKLGKTLKEMPVQALPKEWDMGKPAGLSETQVNNIKSAVSDRLSKITLQG